MKSKIGECLTSSDPIIPWNSPSGGRNGAECEWGQAREDRSGGGHQRHGEVWSAPGSFALHVLEGEVQGEGFGVLLVEAIQEIGGKFEAGRSILIDPQLFHPPRERDGKAEMSL